MSEGQRETEWGTRWANTQRLRGFRARKIDASANAGLPDWLVTEHAGMYLAELKAVLSIGRNAYRPGQLREDQRLSMNEIASVCDEAVRVVVVGPDGFVTLTWAQAQRPLTRREFERRMEAYGG